MGRVRVEPKKGPTTTFVDDDTGERVTVSDMQLVATVEAMYPASQAARPRRGLMTDGERKRISEGIRRARRGR